MRLKIKKLKVKTRLKIKEKEVAGISEIMYIKVEVCLIGRTPGLRDKNESPPHVEDSIFENGENIDKHAFINRTQRSQPITHPQDTNLGHQNDVCRCSLPT